LLGELNGGYNEFGNRFNNILKLFKFGLYKMMPTFFKILRCPVCKGEIEQAIGRFFCPFCETGYPILDGIPDLIPAFLDDQIKESITAWNNLGYDYDAQIAQTVPERLQAIDTPLLAQCADGKMVLEIGCGTARLKKLVEQAGSQYIGLDPSLKLLRQGIARGEAELIRGVGEYLPFNSGSFDVVLGGYCSFRYIQLDKLYPECSRVLKPGGVLAFTLWNNWYLFLHSIVQNVLQKKIHIPRFRTKNCNDVISPAREIKRLTRAGFMIESIFSTKNIPLLKRLPLVKSIFNWHDYWIGELGALFGYDIIFICKHC
jgi:SAM-dependent methyltransferase